MKILNRILISVTLISTMQADTITIYFGTSRGRDNGSKGIYATSLDTDKGAFSGTPALVAELTSPGFQVLHDSKPILYSIGSDPETDDPRVYSFALSPDGRPGLTPVNSQPTNAGKSTHLDVDPSGRLLVTVQYGDGTVSVFPLARDGSILPTTQTLKHEFSSKAHENRQEKPHPHNVTFDPSGNFALVPDLGADLVYIYKADYNSKKLVLHDKAKTNPSAGPRHMTFSSDGKFAYVLNELDQTVDAFAWNSREGHLSHLATVEGLPHQFKDPDITNTASEIRIHPNRRFMYTANRGQNSLSVFRLDPDSRVPELLEIVPAQVDWPRNFNVSPDGDWLVCAGQFSNDVVLFRIDQQSGRIEFQSGSRISVPGPICVLPVAP